MVKVENTISSPKFHKFSPNFAVFLKRLSAAVPQLAYL